MRRKGAAIVQRDGGWYGITLAVREKEIAELRLIEKDDPAEIRAELRAEGYGVAVENASAYLFDLAFPFSDRRKIKLVIGGEIEERLPVPAEDLAVDFVETAKGSVLAAAVPKSLCEELDEDKHVRITTVQAIAALHALRWFNVVNREDFVFIHINGSAAVVMAFAAGRLHALRQFFHSAQSDSLYDAIGDIVSDKDFSPGQYVMVSDGGDGASLKADLEQMFNIRIDAPSSRLMLKGEGPDPGGSLWTAVGAALLSMAPKGQLNLTGPRHAALFLSTKAALRLSAALAAFGLLAVALFSLDYYIKEGAYRYLVSEPMRVYRMSFPKSPPVMEPAKVFRQKIRLLEKEPGVVALAPGPLAVLDDISRRIGPDIDVKVSEFTCDEKEFSLTGTTVSFASVEKIKAAVEQIRGVSQVEMQNLDLAAGRQVKFKLKGRI